MVATPPAPGAIELETRAKTSWGLEGQWNRILTDEELETFERDPFALFAPVEPAK